MWRHHPQTTLARELVTGGAIGRLAYVRAALTSASPRTTSARSVRASAAAPSATSAATASAPSRLFGEPTQVYAIQVRDSAAGVDLRLAATLSLPGDVLAQFDIALDLIRRDELELVGTEASPSPTPGHALPTWSCPETAGSAASIDPEGASGLTDPDHDVYRTSSSTPPRRPSPEAASRRSAVPTRSPRRPCWRRSTARPSSASASAAVPAPAPRPGAAGSTRRGPVAGTPRRRSRRARRRGRWGRRR